MSANFKPVTKDVIASFFASPIDKTSTTASDVQHINKLSFTAKDQVQFFCSKQNPTMEKERITKIATYNVKRFDMPDLTSILRLLDEEDVDICGLQEVPGKTKLEKLIAKDSKYGCVFDEMYFSYGNGLIYRKDRYTVQSKKLHILKNGKGKKGALEVVLKTIAEQDQTSYRVFVTHLDHKTEPQRLSEIDVLLKIATAVGEPHFIIGDFNSLKQQDYTEEEWVEIARVRYEGNWESPQIDVVARMESTGYRDLLNPESSLHVLPTSRFNTRVDYIFASPSIDPKSIVECAVIESKTNESDHKPVIASMRQNK